MTARICGAPHARYHWPMTTKSAGLYALARGARRKKPFIALGSLKQPSGKWVSIWAVESDCDPAELVSNTFEMEWPPRSGCQSSFPEIDRAGWFRLGEAALKLSKGQVPFLARLADALRACLVSE